MREEQAPYNPLDKVNLGKSVADALMSVDVRPLDDTKNLVGAGVYALYYTGDFPLYAPIKERNTDNAFEVPIYVGKAVPKGARKGGTGFDAGSGRALRDRLNQHAASIAEANNLDLADFHYRALTVDDIWIPLGENVVIEKYQPLWNRVIDGFGNKTPGKGRATQKLSSWDALHPGRKFVTKLGLAESKLTPEEIEKRIADFFAGTLSPLDLLAPDAEDGNGDGDAS